MRFYSAKPWIPEVLSRHASVISVRGVFNVREMKAQEKPLAPRVLQPLHNTVIKKEIAAKSQGAEVSNLTTISAIFTRANRYSQSTNIAGS